MKIVAVEVFPVRYPTVGRFKFFEGPPGQPAGRPSVLLKIVSEDGTAGWGQSVPSQKWSYETLESVESTLRLYLVPELLGRDACDLEAIHAVMNRAIAGSFSTGQPIAKAGIDLALYDLLGRARGQSLAQLWNRSATAPVTLSWTLNPRELAEIEGLVAEGRARGYRHFNVKVAPNPDFDLALCRQVQQLAPEGFLWADANGGYDEVTALKVAPKLADLGVAVLEQPLPANRLRGYQRLKRQAALPIIMDEGLVSTVDLEEFIALGLLDGVAIKPARCGGLTEARRQIELAQSAGLMVLGSGLTDPDLSLAASLHLYSAYGLSHPAALNGPQFLARSLLAQPLRVVEGQIQVPTGPGLGVEVAFAKLEELGSPGPGAPLLIHAA